MFSKKLKISILLLLNQILLFPLTAAHAAPVSLTFSGEIADVITDSGSSYFSGLTVADSFSGSLIYGGSESDASSPVFIEPPSAFWTFEDAGFGGSLTTSMGTINTSATEVILTNDDVMGVDAAQFVSDMTGLTVSAGDVFDAWEALTFDTTNNIGFGVLLLSLDNNLYSDLSYQTAPSSMQDIDLAMVFIQQLDNQGALIYEATGVLNQISAVPLPPAIYLFVTGLFSLFVTKRVF